jgi:uncharacterized protein YpmS
LNKKRIFATILVIQLIFLVILTIFVVQNETAQFEHEKEYRTIASYRIASAFADIQEGTNYLRSLNADNTTLNAYNFFVNTTFGNYYKIDVQFNGSYLRISDSNLEIMKEGWI